MSVPPAEGPPTTLAPVPPAGRVAAAWHRRVGGLPRPFWVLVGAQLVNRVGGFVAPFLALYLRDRGLTVGQVGVVLAANGAGTLISQVAGGVLADRVGRRATVVGGMVAAALSLVTLGVVSGFPALLGAAFVAGIAVDLYRPASNALVADLVPAGADRARAYGLLFWVYNLGFSVAAVLAGIAAAHGYLLLFLVDAASFLVCAAALWRGVPEFRPARVPGQAAGLGTVLRDRLLLVLTGCMVVFVTVFFQFFTTLPLVLADQGGSTAAYGAVLAVNGVVVIVVQPVVLPWLSGLPRPLVLAGSQSSLCGAIGLFAFCDRPLEYGVVVGLATLGEIGNATVAQALVSDLAPPELRGRYLGVYGTAFGIGALAAPLAGSALLVAGGPGLLWGSCAAAGVVLGAVQLAAGPAVRRRNAV